VTELEHMISVQCEAGESPHWNAEKGLLYWADIVDPHLYKYTLNTGRLEKYPADIHLTGFGLRQNSGFVLASKTGLYLADDKLADLRLVIDPEQDKPAVRFNDGLVDPQGRYCGRGPALCRKWTIRYCGRGKHRSNH